MSDADAWKVQHSTEVDCKSGTPRVVATGGVDEDYVRAYRQPADHVRKQRTDPECEQAGNVRTRGDPDQHSVLGRPATAHDDCGRPCRITRSAHARRTPCEAHPGRRDAHSREVGGTPRCWAGGGKGVLSGDQLIGRSRPSLHGSSVVLPPPGSAGECGVGVAAVAGRVGLGRGAGPARDILRDAPDPSD
jgi:hypothetical protein